MDDRRVAAIMQIEHYGIKRLSGKTDDKIASNWSIVGFDSEYNSQRDEVISYQLWHSTTRNAFIPGPKRLSIRDIARESQRLTGHGSKVLITSYFNTAELSQLSNNFWSDSELEIYPAHPSGILHIQGKEKNFEFFYFDLWHWFASMKNNSLYAVAEMLGFEKVDWHRKGEDHKRSISTLRSADLQDRKFVDYAMHDAKLCVDIFSTLDRTYREINNVSIISRPTPANASQASFRRSYLKRNVDVPRGKIRELSLRANWGGRAECGFIGTLEGIYEFDADSLYPRSTLLLPNLPAAKDWHGDIPSSFDGVEGFIDLDFRFKDKEEVWPSLPVFNRGSLIFPLRGRTQCTIGELRAALQRDGFVIDKIHDISWYRNGSHAEFHSFLRDQISLKERYNNNAAIRAVAKLNMNSAIGKFVQWKGGYNYNIVSKYLKEMEITDPELMRLYYDGQMLPAKEWLDNNGYNEGLSWYREPIRLGASFYPEWHTLILGKAREQISRAVYDNPSYPRCLTIATDAMYIPRDSISGRELVPFKRERGPMVFKPFRTRRHLSLDSNGQILASAHHGMPMPAQEAAWMMAISNHEETIEVMAKGMYTAREAISRNRRFGASKTRSISISFAPDNKRRISDSGWTYPHNSVEDIA